MLVSESQVFKVMSWSHLLQQYQFILLQPLLHWQEVLAVPVQYSGQSFPLLVQMPCQEVQVLLRLTDRFLLHQDHQDLNFIDPFHL